jgi:hypothetical protein
MNRTKVNIFLLPPTVFMMCLLLSGCGGGYGKELKFNGGQLFYTTAISKDIAERLGNYLVKVGVFNGDLKTVQLNKSGSTFEFRLVVKKGMEQDQEIIQFFKIFCKELSNNVFNSGQVDIHLCDEHLKTIRVVIS